MNSERNEKKSFLLYIDNWEAVRALSIEQRGLVLTALYEYATELGTSDVQEIWKFLERYPEMDAAAKVAGAFMCTTISRDTRKWLSQQESKRKKALEKRMRGEAVTVPPKSYAGSQNYPGASGSW
ncbi:MAG: hypothetical protein IIW19_05510 [Clostridia bacterium]|nr:hypothetical protein [Clostridia bacterium]